MAERVLITGGEGELAVAIAAAFRAHGDRVSAPGRAELDVADPDAVTRYFSAAEPCDLLVANAGLADDALLARLGEDDWDRHFAVNLHGAFRCARAAVRGMLRRRRGHVVFLSSQSAVHPPAGQAAYAASKAGLDGLARSLARELGPANIRVNLLRPGFLATRMTRGLSEARRDEVRRDHLLGRFNRPGEVAAFLVHLHHALPHTSGQVFQLDSRIS